MFSTLRPNYEDLPAEVGMERKIPTIELFQIKSSRLITWDKEEPVSDNHRAFHYHEHFVTFFRDLQQGFCLQEADGPTE